MSARLKGETPSFTSCNTEGSAWQTLLYTCMQGFKFSFVKNRCISQKPVL